jgi:hypothetical protein
MRAAYVLRDVGIGRRTRAMASLWLLVATSAGCPDDDDGAPACVELDEGCAPLYAPIFEQVYAETLAPRCSVEGVSCHANPDALGGRGGFWFDDPEGAYDLLLDAGPDDGSWVIPGDAGCSPLMQRLESDDPFFVMPPGSQPMEAGVRCSIARWIDAGAAR